jgi:hypothetical protein
MNKDKVIATLCTLPMSHKLRGDVSEVDLIRESGYLNIGTQILESDIEAHLRQRPELIDVWLQHSEDQRCSPAWYLVPPKPTERDATTWRIGYTPQTSTEHKEREYGDAYSACAWFIKNAAETLKGFAGAS